MDDMFARAGKLSAVLQLKIDQLRAAKTHEEVMIILFRDADVVRPKIETELLCMVASVQQIKLNPSINAKNLKDEQHNDTNHAVLERIKKVKVEKPPVYSKKNTEPKPKQNVFFNLIKAVGIVVLIFFGVALLSAIFDKKDTSPKIEYTIVYTTINGQFYEKEATAEDFNSGFVTFSDGTRVPWSAVKSKKAEISVSELSNAFNVLNAPPHK